MDPREEEDMEKLKIEHQDEESPSPSTAKQKQDFSVERHKEEKEEEGQQQSASVASSIERSSVEKSSVRQKLKCFTQAEVVAQDSDSAGDAYDADVDDGDDDGVKSSSKSLPLTRETHIARVQNEREHIYELFQPWALKTYGDQAKTKTITLRKKARILKALEGKEHSRPDSSKFRFWVKSKSFSTKRPEGFAEVPGSQHKAKPFPPDAVLSDSPSEVDLFVASTSKDFGKRTYRKVAVVEEFFDIIYNVHMELGGRSGMHAGQKRTYRIITETYAFLPREAVTRFLSTCPECKKNLRPSSPCTSSGHNEEPHNESSSEVEALNYSSHTESSIEAGPTGKSATATTTTTTAKTTTTTKAKKRRHSQQVSAFSQTQKLQPKAQSTPQPQQQTLQQQGLQQQPRLQQQTLQSISEPIHLKSKTSSAELHPHDKHFEASSRESPSTSHACLKKKSPTLSPAGPTSFSGLSRPDPFKAQQDAAKLRNPNMPKIRINPHFQRRRRLSSPTLMAPEPVAAASLPFNPLSLDFASLKTHESLFRYYEFMRRFYGGNSSGFLSQPTSPTVSAPSSCPIQVPVLPPVLAPPIHGSPLLRSLRFPPTSVAEKKLSLATPTLDTKRLRDADERRIEIEVKSLEDDDRDADDAVSSAALPTSKKFKLSIESSQSLKSAETKNMRSILKIQSQQIEQIPQQQQLQIQQQQLQLQIPQQQQLQLEQQLLLLQNQQQHQISAINLSKSFHFSSTSNGGASATSSTSTAPTASIKVECSTLPASSPVSASVKSNTCQATALPPALRIPQISRLTTAARAAASTSTTTTPSSPAATSSMLPLLPPLDLERLKPITSTYLQLTRSMGLSDEDALRFDNLVSKDFKYSL